MKKSFKPGKKAPITKQAHIEQYYPILFPKTTQDPKKPQDPSK